MSFLADLVPGELATVQPRKSWVLGTHPYLSGELLSMRLVIDDVRAGVAWKADDED